MISISAPGIASVIQGVMIKYAYFDIFYTELWMSSFMTRIGLNIDEI
jgi:hypothetical protein